MWSSLLHPNVSVERAVYWWEVDTLEFHACTYRSPWHAQMHVFRHQRFSLLRNETSCSLNAESCRQRETSCNCHKQFPQVSTQYHRRYRWQLVYMSSQTLIQHQDQGCSNLWESHPEASVRGIMQQILHSVCCSSKQGHQHYTAQITL